MRDHRGWARSLTCKRRRRQTPSGIHGFLAALTAGWAFQTSQIWLRQLTHVSLSLHVRRIQLIRPRSSPPPLRLRPQVRGTSARPGRPATTLPPQPNVRRHMPPGQARGPVPRRDVITGAARPIVSQRRRVEEPPQKWARRSPSDPGTPAHQRMMLGQPLRPTGRPVRQEVGLAPPETRADWQDGVPGPLPTAQPQIDLEQLTDRVVRHIDRRMVAYGERLGRI